MRAFVRIGRTASWIFLVLSLAFTVYLYPGPTTAADALITRSTATGGSSSLPSDATRLADAEKDQIRASFRRSWTVNLGLLILGFVAGVLWMKLYRSPKRWLAVGAAIALMAFALVFVLVVAAQDGGTLHWIGHLWSSLATSMSIGAWRYAAIEAHRLLSFGLSILGLMFVAVAWATLPPRT